jgi:hypothetical protein
MSRGQILLLLSIQSIQLALTGCGTPQTKAPTADGALCLRMTQDFYDWYLPLTHKEMKEMPWGLAVRTKTDLFSPALVSALKADSDAKEHSSGDQVGIDFDPFLASQDPADHYQARNVTCQANRCLVEIWSGSSAPTADKTSKPDVIVELVQEGGTCRFLNFRYPSENSDLLTILAQKP